MVFIFIGDLVNCFTEKINTKQIKRKCPLIPWPPRAVVPTCYASPLPTDWATVLPSLALHTGSHALSSRSWVHLLPCSPTLPGSSLLQNKGKTSASPPPEWRASPTPRHPQYAPASSPTTRSHTPSAPGTTFLAVAHWGPRQFCRAPLPWNFPHPLPDTHTPLLLLSSSPFATFSLRPVHGPLVKIASSPHFIKLVVFPLPLAPLGSLQSCYHCLSHEVCCLFCFVFQHPGRGSAFPCRTPPAPAEVTDAQKVLSQHVPAQREKLPAFPNCVLAEF